MEHCRPAVLSVHFPVDWRLRDSFAAAGTQAEEEAEKAKSSRDEMGLSLAHPLPFPVLCQSASVLLLETPDEISCELPDVVAKVFSDQKDEKENKEKGAKETLTRQKKTYTRHSFFVRGRFAPSKALSA